MKIKKILNWIGLLLLASSIIIPFQTKADNLDFNDLFNGEGQPKIDDAYKKLLSDYDNTRWYNQNTNISINCENNKINISSPLLIDNFLDEVYSYRLFISPYTINQLKDWDSSIDKSKIIYKRFINNSNQDFADFSIPFSDITKNTRYYWFIVPLNMYDEVWTPSYQIEINTSQCITLKPWLNTFSTPAIIKSLTFSNGWNNISFAKMEKWKWTPVTFTNNNVKSIIRPLDGFIIRNSNSTDITMTIEYDTDIDINDALHQKQLDAWWNFLWITKTNNPFGSIANAIAMDIIDFTIWNSNKIDLSNLKDATSFILWKAYGVFVNNSNWVYGWRNNQWNDECIWMNQANVHHSIEDWTIIFSWDQIQWDSVTISIFDDERWYVPLGTVNMDEREFRYQITARGEHRFLISNGCSDLYYTVDITLEQAYSSELIDAYNWARDNDIIPNSPINTQYMYETLFNIDLADIMNRYAENVLNRTPDTTKSCSFNDISDLTNGQKIIIRKSCQLWLMPWDQTSPSFDPYEDVTRAVFGTALSRTLWWDHYEWWIPYYGNHLNALKAAGIMNNIANPENTKEIKWYVLLMLMRASWSWDYECKDLDQANINHSINNWIITLNWDAVYWDEVKIRIFNPEEDKYIKLRTVSMEAWSFRYQVKWEWEQNFKLENGCSEINYRVDNAKPAATLTNNITKTVEFPTNEVSRKVVFDGNFTALDSNGVMINTLHIQDKSENACYNNEESCPVSTWKIQFSLIINWEEYDSKVFKNLNEDGYIIFDDIELEKNESVRIKIEAEYQWDYSTWTKNFWISLSENYGLFGEFSADLAPIKIVDRVERFSIKPETLQDTILLKADNSKLAEFTLKPTNNSDWYLSGIILQWWNETTQTPINLADDVVFEFDWTEVDPTALSRNHEYLYEIDETVPSAGINIKVESKNAIDWVITISIYAINDNYNGFPLETFRNRFESALLYIDEQEDMDDYTKYTLWIDKSDNCEVSNLRLYTWYDSDYEECVGELSIYDLDDDELEDGNTFKIDNWNSDQMIKCINYNIVYWNVNSGWNRNVTINSTDYPDYFKTNGVSRKVFARN